MICGAFFSGNPQPGLSFHIGSNELMLELTAEEFAQRAFDLNLVDQRELESVWSHFGTRNVPSLEFQNMLLQREYMTNYQVERLLKNEKAGFYYGDYKVLYLVGTGSFARVYRAVHRESGKVYALKVLRKRHAEKPPETKKFLREGQMGQKLSHPNIVPIYELHSIRHTHFLVMDFVEGQSLLEFVQIRRQIEPAEAVEIMLGIVSGLHHAWEKGITHRDLKLSNVLMSSDGVPMLVDFGLAGIDGDAGNARTVDYAGLEKVTGVEKGDPRSDIYFTGCMFYHLLTGKSPFAGGSKDSSRFREIVPIRQAIPEIPLAVETVLNKAMQLDATKRYQTQLELMIDLRKARKALDPEFAGSGAAGAIVDPSQMKKVLVVESNHALQNALRSGLKKSGYRASWSPMPSEPNNVWTAIRRQQMHSLSPWLPWGKPGWNSIGTYLRMRRLPSCPRFCSSEKSRRSSVRSSSCRHMLQRSQCR